MKIKNILCTLILAVFLIFNITACSQLGMTEEQRLERLLKEERARKNDLVKAQAQEEANNRRMNSAMRQSPTADLDKPLADLKKEIKPNYEPLNK